MLNDESDTTSTNAIVPLSVVNTHGFDIPGSGSTAMLVMVTADGNAVTMLNDESDTTSTNAIVPLSVVNTHGFDIPGSGSTAMLVMVTAGAALVIFGIIFIIARKKKENA